MLSLWMDLPLTVQQASCITGLSETKIRDEIKSGRLPGKSDGKLYLISSESLRQWYASLPDAAESEQRRDAPLPTKRKGAGVGDGQQKTTLHPRLRDSV